MINVDLSHIESKVAEIIKTDRSLVLVQGELIERYRIFDSVLECSGKAVQSTFSKKLINSDTRIHSEGTCYDDC